MHKQPNMIFIISDQMKPEVLSVYGNRDINTPNLQNMADQGVVFSNFYCNGPLCGPARHAIFTGTYPFCCPAWSQPNCLHVRGLKYMGDFLNELGYETASFGKMHGSPENFDFGFSLSKQSYETGNYFFNDYGKWFYEKLALRKDKDTVLAALKNKTVSYKDMILKDNTCIPRELSEEHWMLSQTEDFLRNRNAGKPFFLHLGLTLPHLPHLTIRTPDEIFDPKKLKVPDNCREFSALERPVLACIREQYKPKQLTKDFSKEDWQGYAASYYSAVMQVDKFVGGIMDLLERQQLKENTIVVFTNDHSEHLGAFGMDQKNTLYDDSIHCPFIVMGPGIPKGQRRSCMAEQVDILPTLVDYAGSKKCEQTEGISLRKAIEIDNTETKEYVYGWYDFEGPLQASVRNKNYKLIVCRYEKKWFFELFDIKEDPLEMNNIFNHADNAEIQRVKDEFVRYFWSYAGEIMCPGHVRKILNANP